MNYPIKVVIQGVGPIGLGTAKLIYEDPRYEIVGAVDIDTDYKGKDLGALFNGNGSSKNGRIGVEVTDDAETVFKKTKPDVVVLATTSSLDSIIPSIEVAARNRVNVVSPCEELFYPEFVDEEKAQQIDAIARKYEVSVLGRGVNPGVLMDAYPLQVFRASGIGVDNLDSIIVYRHDDTSLRREPLLRKTGAGLSPGDFNMLNAQGRLGHVGLRMSAAYLADQLGLSGYEIGFSRDPVVASRPIKPHNYDSEIETGQATGLHEICSVLIGGEEKIRLDLNMSVGVKKKNSVVINGKETDYSKVVDGDVATLRALRDLIIPVVECEQPGLNTVGYVPDPNDVLSAESRSKVLRALESNKNIHYDRTEEDRVYLPTKDGSWSAYVSLWVAPKKGLYTAGELDAFMRGLVPDLRPTKVDSFSQTERRLILGSTHFDEPIAIERIVSERTITVADADLLGLDGFEDGRRVEYTDELEELRRGVDIYVFPNQKIAEAVQNGELQLQNGGISLQAIEEYQPGLVERFFLRRR